MTPDDAFLLGIERQIVDLRAHREELLRQVDYANGELARLCGLYGETVRARKP